MFRHLSNIHCEKGACGRSEGSKKQLEYKHDRLGYYKINEFYGTSTRRWAQALQLEYIYIYMERERERDEIHRLHTAANSKVNATHGHDELTDAERQRVADHTRERETKPRESVLMSGHR